MNKFEESQELIDKTQAAFNAISEWGLLSSVDKEDFRFVITTFRITADKVLKDFTCTINNN